MSFLPQNLPKPPFLLPHLPQDKSQCIFNAITFNIIWLFILCDFTIYYTFTHVCSLDAPLSLSFSHTLTMLPTWHLCVSSLLSLGPSFFVTWAPHSLTLSLFLFKCYFLIEVFIFNILVPCSSRLFFPFPPNNTYCLLICYINFLFIPQEDKLHEERKKFFFLFCSQWNL